MWVWQTENGNRMIHWKENNTLTITTTTTEHSTCRKYQSMKNNNKKKRSQLQQLTFVSTGESSWSKLNVWNPKKCRWREDEKLRKVKLYAEVEFSAQGYDTPSNQPTGRHRPTVFAVRANVPPQDSPSSTTWHQRSHLRLENARLDCMHTHTINRIYNLWLPLTVWTHNSNSSNVTFLQTHFALHFFTHSKHHTKQQLSFPSPNTCSYTLCARGLAQSDTSNRIVLHFSMTLVRFCPFSHLLLAVGNLT